MKKNWLQDPTRQLTFVMNLIDPTEHIFITFLLSVHKSSGGLLLIDWNSHSLIVSDKAKYDWEILGLNLSLLLILLYNIKERRYNNKLIEDHEAKLK